MKLIKFPGSNFSIGKAPVSIAKQGENLFVIRKVLFEKKEIDYIRKNKTLHIIQKTTHDFPTFCFPSPFSEGVDMKIEVIDQDGFIQHQMEYEGHQFLIHVTRHFNNNKLKMRWFNLTMDGDWVKSGNIPESLFSGGTGWLKRLMKELLKEYHTMLESTKK